MTITVTDLRDGSSAALSIIGRRRMVITPGLVCSAPFLARVVADLESVFGPAEICDAEVR